MCIRALLPKSASVLRLAEFWRMPFFTEWSGASSFEVIVTRQSSHFPTWASASRTSGSRCILTLCFVEDLGERFGCVDFARLLIPCRKLQLSPFEHCPFTLFCHLILDHRTCLIIFVSGPKILISNFLLDTPFHHSFQSVIFRS